MAPSFQNFGRIALALVIVLVHCDSTISAVSPPTSYRLVAGFRTSTVASNDAHLYKEYVPLIFQFDIPRWNKSEMMIHGSQNCSANQFTKFFTTCPVLYYMSQVQDRFSEYFSQNQPIVVALADINAQPENNFISFDCELIKPHFDDIFMNKNTLDEYLNQLKSCSPLGDTEFIKGISNYVYNISDIFLQMRRNFYTEYWLKIDLLDGRVDAALWSNAIKVLNSLLYENYMMETNRWKFAVMDCEAGRIPSTVLPPSLFKDTLDDMLENLAKKNLLPAVSTETVGNYYKSSLTDCTFTNDTFLTRVLVPVMPQYATFVMEKVVPMSFYYYDSETQFDFECQLDPKVLPPISKTGDSYILLDKQTNIAYESDCQPGKLCHIPTMLHPRKINSCATSSYAWERAQQIGNVSDISDAYENVIRNCPVTCKRLYSPKNHLVPFVSRQFSWFNSQGKQSKDNLVITCINLTSSTVNQSLTFSSISYGNLIGTVPCNCESRVQSQLYKAKPCYQNTDLKQDLVVVSQVAPIQWYDKVDLINQQFKVSKSLFFSPNDKFIKNEKTSLTPGARKSSSSSLTTVEFSFPVGFVLLALLSVCLVVLVGALAWRQYTLIRQLQAMGFNVMKTDSIYNITTPREGSNSQQVSYRNMSSVVDTDNLLISEEYR